MTKRLLLLGGGHAQVHVLQALAREPLVEGHSVFAWHFMRALEGLGADQWQMGGMLYDRVRAGVVKDFPQTPQYGTNRAGGHQGNTDYLFERREFVSNKP